MRYLIPTLVLFTLPLAAQAARPLITDDARLTNAESCQLESWTRIYSDSRETWALPACNPTGNLELTLGAGRARHEGEPLTSDYIFQAKTLFRPLQPNGWGVGLVGGTVLHPEIHPGPNQLGNIYAYIPVSISFSDDTVVIHTNIGWLKDHASGDHNMSWGIAGEFKIAPRLLAIAESFGDNRNIPYWQIGGRIAIIPDLVQLDATVGQQYSDTPESRWISFGIRLTPDRLF